MLNGRINTSGITQRGKAVVVVLRGIRLEEEEPVILAGSEHALRCKTSLQKEAE